ncbi:MAG: cation:proton antiporter [Synergistaceae bacterium]|nr:monovalent cation/H(+) antiporter subunit G [Synergistota bacterium]NLM71260.1 cation:proton antiporter [Synergistaceae bacterium]
MVVFLLVTAALIVSLIFNSLGAVALYRFPDVYTRLHGTTKCTTFGTIFIVFAVLIYSLGRLIGEGEQRFLVLFIHACVALMVLLITNATGAHALARASHRSGILPAQAVVDKLEESREGGKGA